MFKPFFTTKPLGQRAGLGLAICWDSVSEQGGDMRLESRPQAGSTVTICLPEAEANPW